MATYGVPYQGSKSKIAVDILKLLPKGKRLVDLFGGGGAITHAALLSDKWEEVLYNDINPLITQLFIDAYNGKYKNYKRIVRRAEFEKLKNIDSYVRYICSFGNNGVDYLWAKDIEPIKCKAMELILSEGSIQEKYILYKELIDLINEYRGTDPLNRLQQLERLERIKQLEQLERLGRLQQLEQKPQRTLFSHKVKLEVSNISYEDYQYENGDVVYCDVPYENTKEYNKEKFDSLKFYEWIKTRDYPVYFSSYEISDNSFEKTLVASVRSIFSATNNSTIKNEYLYTYKRG